MNDSISSRSLLLEQLESRCLLAAGMFFISESHDNRFEIGGDDVRGRAQTTGRQPAEISLLTTRQTDTIRGGDQRRSSPRSMDSLRFDRPNHDSSRFEQPVFTSANALHSRPTDSAQNRTPDPVENFSASSISAPLARPTVLSDSRAIQNELNPIPRLNSTANLTGTIFVVRVADPTESLSASKTSTAVANPSSGSVSPAPRPVSSRSLSSPDINPLLNAGNANVAAAAVNARQSTAPIMDETSDSVKTTSPELESDVLSANAHKIDSFRLPAIGSQTPRSSINVSGLKESPSSGYIDPLRSRAMRESDSSAEMPWELDRGTLRRIHDLTEPQSTESNRETNENIDGAIASWFGGRGGLIEMDARQTPMFVGDSASKIVDIVLDATFGLHRSLDLIASAESTSSDQVVRDAVLSAIAGERAEHVAPLAETAPERTAMLPRPSASLVAGSAIAGSFAIASRRRHGNLLLSTHPTLDNDSE